MLIVHTSVVSKRKQGASVQNMRFSCSLTATLAAAAMSFSLTVDFEGSRHKVTVSPSAPLLSVLEQACAKFGKPDAAAFRLATAKGALLDLSLPARLSGLTNNATVDMVRAPGAGGATGGGDATVKVAVQGPADRVAVAARPTTTLAHLLELALAGGLSGLPPFGELTASNFAGVAMTFMRTQIAGLLLPNTTLGSMGLVSGSASFRVTYSGGAAGGAAQTAPVSLVAASPVASAGAGDAGFVAAPAPATPLQAAAPQPLQPLQGQPMEDDEEVQVVGSAPAAVPHTAPAAAAAAAAQPLEPSTTGPPSLSRQVREAIAKLRRDAFDGEARDALVTITKICDNLISRPGDAGVRRLRLGNPKFFEAAGRFPGALELLGAVGFVRMGPGVSDSWLAAASAEPVLAVLPPDAVAVGAGGAGAVVEDDERTATVRELVAAHAVGLGGTVPPPPAVDLAARRAAVAAVAAAAAAFDPFKPVLTRLGDGPAPPPSAGAAGGATRLPSVAEPVSVAVRSSTGVAASSSSSSASPSPIVAAPGPEAVTHVPPVVAVVQAERPPHLMTDTERKVYDLHLRRARLQADNAPKLRRTRVVARPTGAPESSSGGGAASSSSSDVFDPRRFDAAALDGGALSLGGGAGGAAMADDVPDTDPEAQRMLAEWAKKKMAELTEEKGFKTAALRELETLKGARVFTTALLRVQTPDRVVLEGVFSPLEPLANVYNWVRSLLAPELAAAFSLYTTPPPAPLEDSRVVTLQDARLLPAVLVYLSWGAAAPAGLVASGPEAYLSPSGLQLLREPVSYDEPAASSGGGAAAGAAAGGGFPTSTPLVATAGPSDAELDAMAAAVLNGGRVPAAPAGGAAKPKNSAAVNALAAKLLGKR